MSTELTYNQALEWLPLYALGALEPDEMLAVDAYIQAHPTLLTSLHEIEETIAQLAYTAPPTPLPRDGRTRLLDRAHADLEEVAPSLAMPATDATAATPRANTQAMPAQRPRRPSGWFMGANRWAVATACALLMFLALGLYTIQLRSQLTNLTAETVTLRQTNQQLRDEVLRDRQQFARFINAERSVALKNTRPGEPARGTFALNGDQGEFVVSGLPPLPADQTYQAWLVPPGGTPTSVGLLSVNADGTATLTVAIPAGLRSFSIADVSIERAGGSEQITKETIVLRGSIS